MLRLPNYSICGRFPTTHTSHCLTSGYTLLRNRATKQCAQSCGTLKCVALVGADGSVLTLTSVLLWLLALARAHQQLKTSLESTLWWKEFTSAQTVTQPSKPNWWKRNSLATQKGDTPEKWNGSLIKLRQTIERTRNVATLVTARHFQPSGFVSMCFNLFASTFSVVKLQFSSLCAVLAVKQGEDPR